MDNKLTYKILDILVKNEYTEVTIKNKITFEEVNVNNANIEFRYDPAKDRGYLNIVCSKGDSVCTIDDESINEVIVNADSISIETGEKNYNFYQDKDKLYY